MAFSPDGATLASVGDHSARLWDLRAPRVTGHALATRTDLSFGAAFSPDSRTVAIPGQDQKVGLWDAVTRRRRDVELAGRHFAGLESLAFSPDGRLLAGGGTDNAVRLWNVGAPPRGLQSTVPSPRAAFRVAFDRNGRTCASSSGDRVDLWDWRSRRIRGQVKIGSVILDLDLSADGRTLGVLRLDGKVQLIDVPTRRVRGPARILPGVHADEMALSPDGRMLAITDFEGQVFLASTASGRSLGRPLTRNPSGNVFAVAFSPDSRTLATGGGDLRSELWDVRARRRIGVLIGHGERVSDIAFSPDGSMLVSTGADRTVRRWDMRSRRQIGAPLATGTGPASVVAVSPDGEAIAAANDAGTVRFWDAHTGRTLGAPLRSRGASSIAFAPDGAGLVVGSQNPGVLLWTPAVWSNSQRTLRGVV